MAEFAPLINGVAFSGASIRVNILGVSLPDLKGIDFKMTAEKTNIHAAGRKVNSRSFGKEDFSGSLKLLINGVNALESASPELNPLKLPPFDIIVSFREGTKVVSYTLVACDFTEWSGGGSTSDKELVVTMPFIYADQLRTR